MSENPNTNLPKWPFLTGDIVLILLACFIVVASPKPMSGMGIFACALSVILGMLVYVTPYIIEHLTQQQRIKLKQAKAEETLLKAVELASDLLNRTESIHAELMKGVLNVKQVPAILEEKTEELLEIVDSEKLAASLTELGDLLNRLESQPFTHQDETEKADQSEEQFRNLHKAISNIPTPDYNEISETLETKLEQIRNEVIEKLSEIEDNKLTETKIEEVEAESSPDTEIDSEDDSDESTTSEEKDLEIIKSIPEEEAETESLSKQEDFPESEEINLIDDPTEAEDSILQTEEDLSQITQDFNSQPNEDGATRLIVGAFIGISNKLYIRGDGPGLDWDKGTPMELVGIGKWEWKTYAASAAIQCKVLINDEQWTDTENLTIEPNTTLETTASF
ncbi:hypothetical protein F7C95_12605 [Opitutia bacterium ISCC 51]|nr:hypothetical protein F7C95_12605 [Opitutae bacterium ISCC 51]QXD26859.1 hypothetical protein GA003_12535 [Opitutae bacterium ISCC 52]